VSANSVYALLPRADHGRACSQSEEKTRLLRAENDNRNRMRFHDAARRFKTIALGHLGVHHHDVRFMARDKFLRLSRIARRFHNLQTLLVIENWVSSLRQSGESSTTSTFIMSLIFFVWSNY
jgi:hypothetical protein